MSVRPLPNDKPITPALIAEHKISLDEMQKIRTVLGREPTYTELGVFSVMWSEHCSYKSSRVHLRRLPTKGPRVIQGPGENAGVVDIGDGFAAVFKMESHNHPSFIEPYQGAATGVGGILRDVFTMGARPIASLDSLRFGRPDHPRTKELLRGVVAGIGGYGNCFGVPTVGGEVQFDEAYDTNILVNAFTCGVARTDRIFYGRAAGIGNPILYMGTKTGRDGIHGATMASDEFGEAKNAAETASAGAIKKGERSTMQVGDPFMGKLLLEACLELFSTDLLEGIQDMGAAGLTSSSVEMAGRAETGIELDLDLIPRRAKAMQPYEILLSESQERMLLVAKRGNEGAVLDICRKWGLDCAVVGRVTDTKRWVIKATPGYDPLTGATASQEKVTVCDLPIDALTDAAPVYDRPRTTWNPPRGDAAIPASSDVRADFEALLASPNVGSKRWIIRQYDHIVRGGTVVRPGSDAAVVRVPCERDEHVIYKYLAFASDCNGRFVELAPEEGAKMAVAEVCRNLVVSGAEPIGMTDCLNFANPEKPEIMDQFARAIDGIAAACNALTVPIVSGNVSLYNETTTPQGRKPILPTPTVAAVGLVTALEDVVTSWFKNEGDIIVALGKIDISSDRGLLGSEYAALQAQRAGKSRSTAFHGSAPSIDLEAETKLQTLMLALARAHIVQSAHDVSDGGLLVALAECATGGPDATGDRGAVIALTTQENDIARTATIFGEAPTRIVLSVRPAHEADVLARAAAAGVPVRTIGRVAGTTLAVTGLCDLQLPVKHLRTLRESCLAFVES